MPCRLLIFLLLATTVSVHSSVAQTHPDQTAPLPNIVLIFTDDQGINDVSCYGSEIPTPNIDRLAREGLKFTNFYAASSICTPSRFGLLTGQNPARSQDQLLSALMFLPDEDKDRGLRPHETTVAGVLRDRAGYDTALIGKWHLGHGDNKFLPTNHGFNSFIGHTGGCIDFFTMTYGIVPDWYHDTEHVNENGYATELISEEAIAYLKSRADGASATAASQFFLFLPYNAPHFGKGWSPADEAPVNIMQPQAADLKRVDFIQDKVRREFAAMVVSLDDGVGQILDTLDETGLAENTLVIFMTDHGGDPRYGGSNRPYRGDKATLFEGGIHVPCLMRWPGKIEPGSTTNALTWALDIFPTLSHFVGADVSDLTLDGKNIAPIILDGDFGDPNSNQHHAGRELFWETGKHAHLDRGNWIALRQGPWKYLQDPNADTPFLFNLTNDPLESLNQAPLQPERLAEM
ncbi:MAG: sulfatase-like hydrolase/transferase, partial [Verrucomicrobiota bacterium]